MTRQIKYSPMCSWKQSIINISVRKASFDWALWGQISTTIDSLSSLNQKHLHFSYQALFCSRQMKRQQRFSPTQLLGSLFLFQVYTLQSFFFYPQLLSLLRYLSVSSSVRHGLAYFSLSFYLEQSLTHRWSRSRRIFFICSLISVLLTDTFAPFLPSFFMATLRRKPTRE